MTQQSEAALKKVIENLIEAGTSFNVDQLDMIYHTDLQVIMLSETGEKIISNKEAFKSLFPDKPNAMDRGRPAARRRYRKCRY